MKMNLEGDVYVKGLRHELKAPELFTVDKITKEKILKAYIFPVKDTLY